VGSVYAFRIRGPLSPEVLDALQPLRPVQSATETVLSGEVVDQAALHGVIARLEQLGVELVELVQLPEAHDGPSPRTSDVSEDRPGDGRLPAMRSNPARE
jgi:hypothetical protein